MIILVGGLLVPHPKRRFRKFTAAVPGHGQVALGAKKGRWVRPPRCGSGPGPGPRHFHRPKRQLAMAWRRRQAMGTPSNWERPVTGNAIPLNGNAQ